MLVLLCYQRPLSMEVNYMTREEQLDALAEEALQRAVTLEMDVLRQMKQVHEAHRSDQAYQHTRRMMRLMRGMAPIPLDPFYCCPAVQHQGVLSLAQFSRSTDRAPVQAVELLPSLPASLSPG